MTGPGRHGAAGAANPADGEEADWTSENPWQALVSETIARLRQEAQHDIAAWLAGRLLPLSEQYDR